MTEIAGPEGARGLPRQIKIQPPEGSLLLFGIAGRLIETEAEGAS